MKIIIDVMSGDNAPGELILGAYEAAGEFAADIILTGDENIIKEVAANKNLPLEERRISIVHTEGVVTMEDSALSVVREKSDSSMGIGLKMLAEGGGDAFVSAGNTGALHAGSSLVVRRIKGIQRSAIAIIMPFVNPVLLIDAGANVELEPAHMLQFGIMGSIYMNKIFGVEEPRVGLLNNGSEPTKGTKKLIESYSLLSSAENINFCGNIEAKTLPFGVCDVLVTDGFSGNILLKTIEGLGAFFMDKLKGIFYSNLLTKASSIAVRGGLKKMKSDFDASEYGGAPLLGLSKPVIKAHGGSDAKAIKNAVRQAISYIDTEIIVEIVRQMILPASTAPSADGNNAGIINGEQENGNE